MRWDARCALMILALALAATLLVGCGGNNEDLLFQSISERVSYNPAGSRIAYAAFGGNELLYVYSMSSAGGGQVLLTPSDNDTDLSDEGGKMPAWAPNGSSLAIVSRRGAGQALFLMDPTVGDTVRLNKLTDDTALGADAQPSWSSDSSKLVYVSNKGTASGKFEIFVISSTPATPPAPTLVPITNASLATVDKQWPVFSPDGTKIAFQSGIPNGTAVDTDIWVVDVAGGDATNLTSPAAANSFRDEAPSWSPDGKTIAFHTNRRAQDFDIWVMNADGSNTQALTSDFRSDGFPTFSPVVGGRIAFTRDRQIWTMAADGSDQLQLTRWY